MVDVHTRRNVTPVKDPDPDGNRPALKLPCLTMSELASMEAVTTRQSIELPDVAGSLMAAILSDPPRTAVAPPVPGEALERLSLDPAAVFAGPGCNPCREPAPAFAELHWGPFSGRRDRD
jgi:hypothetical protein